MNTCVVGLSHFVAAAGAVTIMAVGASAFLSSSAPIEREPFQLASIRTANAEVRVAQWHRRACPNNPEALDPLTPVCLRV
jgi:hypothetical protein